MNFLDDIQLPKSSSEEELEQLSKNKLRPLFPIDLFEFREETYRDKGIDIILELKYKGTYTNFRFLVQLKSTETKEPNSDGSYSFQIETSNIQYLLNGGLSAYYICYVKQEDIFYCHSLNEFVSKISDKNEDWQFQKTHTLRVSNVLTEDYVNKIYGHVKEKSIVTRKLNEKLEISNLEGQMKKVSIKSDYELTDETEIVSLIEKIGLSKINGGEHKDLIIINEKISSDITSSLYNLIIGIAHYYSSNFFESLAHLQKANRFKSELDEDLKLYLKFYLILVKYSIGLIKHKEFVALADNFKNSYNISDHIRIKAIEQEYINSQSNSGIHKSGFHKYRDDIFSIIENYNVKFDVKFQAKCQYLHYFGNYINYNYAQSMIRINAIESQTGKIDINQRIVLHKNFFSNYRNWEDFLQQLNGEIQDESNIINASIIKINELKVRFELLTYTSILKLEKKISDDNYKDLNGVDVSYQQDSIIENVDILINNFGKSYHVNNLLAAMVLKFEIMQFTGEKSKAESMKAEIFKIIDFHDIEDARRKFTNIIKGGTLTQHLRIMLEEQIEKPKRDRAEYHELVEEMKVFDKLEIEENDNEINEKLFIIELFPIDHFSIPKDKVNVFFKNMKIEDTVLINQINEMFVEGVVPVLNLFNEEIKVEGYCNGRMDDKGIESWRVIKNIRTMMYEMKFRRVNILKN